MRNIVFLLLVLFIAGACTIKKRDYLPGYHVTWHERGLNTKLVKQKKQNITSESEIIEIHDAPLITNNPSLRSVEEVDANDDNTAIGILEYDDNPLESQRPILKTNPIKTSEDAPCDEIILKNGNSIQAKVLEVGLDLIKYKNCDNLEGPEFTIRKSEVVMIQYKNGTRTVIENNNWQDEDEKSDTEVLVDEMDTHLDTFQSDDKSFLVAAVLWFFLGVLGIHRFYLGHIGIGVLYLLTAGLCGIGWIIDGIMLATGSLKPKNGKYIDRDSN